MIFKLSNGVGTATFDNLVWFEYFIRDTWFNLNYSENPDRVVYFKEGGRWNVGVRSLKIESENGVAKILDEFDGNNICVSFYVDTDSPEQLGTGLFKRMA